MKNKFAAKCRRCGFIVAEGQGETNKVDGYWHTFHATKIECENKVRTQTQESQDSKNYHYSMTVGARMHEDYYDSDDYWSDMTSEDVNPNEGSK